MNSRTNTLVKFSFIVFFMRYLFSTKLCKYQPSYKSIQNRCYRNADKQAYDTEEITEEFLDTLDEDGSYYSKDEVALYIHTYNKLPSNYITKKEAKKLGWSGGSLEKYAPGKVIGGDVFGNYEGVLPDYGKYHECDIDTKGKKKRGAKRIVYSDDGRIYYTEDHYETFELLYGEER